MQAPFDIEIYETTYSVFPDGEEAFTVFKEGVEHIHLQRDGENGWLKLHPETGTPLFGMDEEVELLGKAISKHLAS